MVTDSFTRYGFDRHGQPIRIEGLDPLLDAGVTPEDLRRAMVAGPYPDDWEARLEAECDRQYGPNWRARWRRDGAA